VPDTATALAPGETNAVGRMLGLLGDEWTLLILQQALMGAHRYSHFAARLPISNSVLSNRLRLLVAEGMLTADYRTTPRSRSLWPLLLAVWEWERTWVDVHAERLPAMRHEGCEKLFSPVLRCAHCTRPVGAEDVVLTPGPSGQWERSAPASSTRRRSESPDRQGARAADRHAGLFGETMCVLGNRWSAAMLAAAFLGTTRFTDFQTQLGAPPNLVAERLQTFCGIGVLDTATDGSGEYRLTDKGRAFFGVLVAALQWAQRWFRAPEGPALELTHRDCGTAFAGEWACNRCGQRLAGAGVIVEADEADMTVEADEADMTVEADEADMTVEADEADMTVEAG